MAEFVGTFNSCPPTWGLLLYSRAFRHENKKVVRLLCFSALENIRAMSPAESAFLSDALIPLTANMFLYDIVDSQCRRRPQSPKMARLLRQFCARNPVVLPCVFDGLSRRSQSAPPLFYWLAALEQEWTVTSECAMTHELIHDAARELLTKCLKTHPILIRSAAESLICAILIKCSTNPDELFFQTLARVSLFSSPRCQTRNVFSQLKRFVDAAAQCQDGALSAGDISVRLTLFDIRARLFKLALSDEPFPTRLLTSVFDAQFGASCEPNRTDPIATHRLVNALFFAAEFSALTKFCQKPWLDQPFAVSFYELLFALMEKWSISSTFLTEGCVESVLKIAKSAFDALSVQMQKLTYGKLAELVVVGVNCEDLKRVKFSLQIAEMLVASFGVPLAESIKAKVQNMH